MTCPPPCFLADDSRSYLGTCRPPNLLTTAQEHTRRHNISRLSPLFFSSFAWQPLNVEQRETGLRQSAADVRFLISWISLKNWGPLLEVTGTTCCLPSHPRVPGRLSTRCVETVLFVSLPCCSYCLWHVFYICVFFIQNSRTQAAWCPLTPSYRTQENGKIEYNCLIVLWHVSSTSKANRGVFFWLCVFNVWPDDNLE